MSDYRVWPVVLDGREVFEVQRLRGAGHRIAMIAAYTDPVTARAVMDALESAAPWEVTP